MRAAAHTERTAGLSGMKPVYRAGHILFSSVFRLFFPGECTGAERIPTEGAFLLAANHMSFLDPPCVGCHVHREIHFFARKTLFTDGWWGNLLRSVNTIPIDLESETDLAAFKQVFRLLKEGNGLLVFPEGTRSPDGRLQPPRAGVGMIACKTRVPVVPARLFGTYEAFGKGRPLRLFTRVHVAFGDPLLPEQYDTGPNGKERYQRAAQRIMEAIADLPPPRPPGV